MTSFKNMVRAAAFGLATIAAATAPTKQAAAADRGDVVAGVAGGLLVGTLFAALANSSNNAYAAPAPAQTYVAPQPTYHAPVQTYQAPVQTQTYTAPVTYYAPAPTYYAPAPRYYSAPVTFSFGISSGHRFHRHRGHHRHRGLRRFHRHYR